MMMMMIMKIMMIMKMMMIMMMMIVIIKMIIMMMMMMLMIQGFLASDIRSELRRGARLKCVHCKKKVGLNISLREDF